MALTLNELKERIVRQYDVCTLCDVLDITEEELLDRFEDRLLETQESFEEEFEDDEGGYYGQEKTE